MQEYKYASILSRNIFDPNLTWPKPFQTERTRRLAHLPSFCELVLKVLSKSYYGPLLSVSCFKEGVPKSHHYFLFPVLKCDLHNICLTVSQFSDIIKPLLLISCFKEVVSKKGIIGQLYTVFCLLNWLTVSRFKEAVSKKAILAQCLPVQGFQGLKPVK